MTIKGKILRDPASGAGLVSANGQQYAFSLEQHWRSDTLPVAGMAVDLEIDGTGALASVSAASTQQQVEEKIKALNEKLKSQGLPAARHYWGALRQRAGLPRLVLVAGLFLGWVAFATVSVRIGGGLTQSATFHDALVLTNAGGGIEMLGGASGGAGWYGLWMWLALLAPLLSAFWASRWAGLGHFAPLVLMAACGFAVRGKLVASTAAAGSMAQFFGGSQAAAMAQRMADEMLTQLMQAISLGFGFYLSIGAALLLAALGTKELLLRR